MKTRISTATILLVDDEPDMAAIVGRSLRINGYKVLTASNGRECLDLAASELPDIILLDNVMPHMDGLTAMRKLRRSESTRDIPVILVTALADEATLASALRAGADAFITKPFDYQTLLDKISSILDARPAG